MLCRRAGHRFARLAGSLTERSFCLKEFERFEGFGVSLSIVPDKRKRSEVSNEHLAIPLAVSQHLFRADKRAELLACRFGLDNSARGQGTEFQILDRIFSQLVIGEESGIWNPSAAVLDMDDAFYFGRR
jgi:hypothetical protein